MFLFEDVLIPQIYCTYYIKSGHKIIAIFFEMFKNTVATNKPVKEKKENNKKNSVINKYRLQMSQ